jgi:CRISPR-associated protein Cas1
VYEIQDVPRFDDKASWVYIERGVLSKGDDGVFFADKEGRTPIPVAGLGLIMLGPGTRVTHRAMQSAAEMNCMVVWAGESGTRLYAHGTGGTSHANRLRRQARIWGNPGTHMQVVRRMYELRFGEKLPEDIALQSVRGREGMRVRRAYESLAKQAGIEWKGRLYDRNDWYAADLPNRCLSVGNAALYGIVHAAIVALGYSPALGFVHTGRPRSFVYDMADLFKFDLVVPAAFRVAANNPKQPERETRIACRNAFHEGNLLSRIIERIDQVLDIDLAEVPDPTVHSWEPAFPVAPGPDD